MKQNPLLNRLRHHVTGAIERGEATAIVAIESPQAAELARLRAQRDALAAALRSALWVADCAIDADINGRKPAGFIRDGITHRVAKMRAALATLDREWAAL